jgi:hypothetical protein
MDNNEIKKLEEEIKRVNFAIGFTKEGLQLEELIKKRDELLSELLHEKIRDEIST